MIPKGRRFFRIGSCAARENPARCGRIARSVRGAGVAETNLPSTIEVTILVRVYNEAASVAPLCARLRPVLSKITARWEVLFDRTGLSRAHSGATLAASLYTGTRIVSSI